MLRVKHLAKTTSEAHKRTLLKLVTELLKNLDTKYPSIDKRLIEIEVK